jgi:hypothetical protein
MGSIVLDEVDSSFLKPVEIITGCDVVDTVEEDIAMESF